jgi:hypothetical protein
MLGESYFYSPFVNSKWYFADIGNAEQASWFLLGTLMAREALQDGDIASTHIASTHIASTHIASTHTASTITSWTSLSSSIAAAAGKTVTLTLSTPFDMAGFKSGSAVKISAAHTHITIVGNGAVLLQPAQGFGVDRFFSVVGKDVALMMSNVTLQLGLAEGDAGAPSQGGALFVSTGGTINLSSCFFGKNIAAEACPSQGGAVYVGTGGIITLSTCTFSGNKAAESGSPSCGQGGAVYIGTGGIATLSSCNFLANFAGGVGYGSAVYVSAGATTTLLRCSFSGNQLFNGGGGVYVSTGGTITLSSCSFSGNIAYSDLGGAALYFEANSTSLLKNCSLLGTVKNCSLGTCYNDIARSDTTANVTFACADGEVGTPVQMSGTEITKLPVLTCSAPKYSCDGLTGICRPDQSGVFPSKQACSSGCTAQPTPAPCQVPRNCGQHNNSVVCGHTFTGCEFVCGKGSDPYNVGCCHANIHADQICNQCVEQLCKPPPPLPPPVTIKYACITKPGYHCVEFSSGTYHSATDCEKDCPPKPLAPSPAAHGHSA